MEFVGLIRVTDLVVMEERGSNECENKTDGLVRISEGMPTSARAASRAAPLAVWCQHCVHALRHGDNAASSAAPYGPGSSNLGTV